MQLTPMSRTAVWLLTKPHPNVHIAVWRLVGCLAVESMDYGRRLLWARSLKVGWPSEVAARVEAVTAISNLAVARFWHNIHDFAASHQAELPNQFHDIPARHPFLAIQSGVVHAQLPLEFSQ